MIARRRRDRGARHRPDQGAARRTCAARRRCSSRSIASTPPIAIPPVGARNTVQLDGRCQPPPGIARPATRSAPRADILRLYSRTDRRRAVRRDHAGDGRRRAAGRPRAGILRDAQQPAAGRAVQLAQRSGVVPGLPRILPRARARAPVVRPGGRLEELSRAVAERGLRAILRRALREGEARRGRVPRRAAPVPHAGRSRIPIKGPVYLGYRLGHIKGESRVFRALVYNKGAAVLHMLRRLIGDEAFFARHQAVLRRATDSRRRAPTICARRWKRPAAATSTASSSAGFTTTASRACATAPPSKARSWSSASSRSATSTTSRSRSAVTYTDGKTAEFVVTVERRRQRGPLPAHRHGAVGRRQPGRRRGRDHREAVEPSRRP